MDKSIWLYMNLSKKKKKKIEKPFSIIDDDWKKRSFSAFALLKLFSGNSTIQVTFLCVCFRQFKWEKVKCDAICRPIRLFMGGLKTFGLFIYFFRIHCIYPCGNTLTIQLCWLCTRHNISDYRRKWFWVHWRVSMMIPTPVCIHHQRRQDWTSKKYGSIWKTTLMPRYASFIKIFGRLCYFLSLNL